MISFLLATALVASNQCDKIRLKEFCNQKFYETQRISNEDYLNFSYCNSANLSKTYHFVTTESITSNKMNLFCEGVK